MDHSVTDQTSVIRFIEDNWLSGQRIGQGSFDGIADSISSLFDFHQAVTNDLYILNPNTGEPVITLLAPCKCIQRKRKAVRSSMLTALPLLYA